jgi:hypothetical protein
MIEIEVIQEYFRCLFGRFTDRLIEDERGSATAEQIMMIGLAVAGAAVVGAIIWSKMTDGANNIETPSP